MFEKVSAGNALVGLVRCGAVERAPGSSVTWWQGYSFSRIERCGVARWLMLKPW